MENTYKSISLVQSTLVFTVLILPYVELVGDSTDMRTWSRLHIYGFGHSCIHTRIS